MEMPPAYLPHIDLLLQSLRISRDRLNSRSKVAIDTRLLRTLLQSLVRQMPFDPHFYLAENADIATAHKSGQIVDLHQHYVESGFFEGRQGAAIVVDETYYAETYPDIGEAIRRGDVASAAEHYTRSGAAEGRMPSAQLRPEIERWTTILTD